MNEYQIMGLIYVAFVLTLFGVIATIADRIEAKRKERAMWAKQRNTNFW